MVRKLITGLRYEDEEGRGSLIVEAYDGEFHIADIDVEPAHRNMGIGRNLLQAIIEDADQEWWTLTLHVDPRGSRTEQELTEWYERYGFELVHGNFMVRQPKE